MVDISLPLREGEVFRLGCPPVKIESGTFYHEDEGGYYTTSILSMPLHSATHIDVVSRDVQILVDRFIGPGKLLDMTGIEDRPIGPEDCLQSNICKGDFVLFKTGWDRYLGTQKYFQHPELSPETVEWLTNKQVNMVGIDASGLGRGKNHGLYDRLLTEKGIYVIENLTNLDRVTAETFRVYCFPLSIEKAEALPARVLVEF